MQLFDIQYLSVGVHQLANEGRRMLCERRSGDRLLFCRKPKHQGLAQSSDASLE